MKKILGLNKHQVELRSYEKDWKEIFAETKELLVDALKEFTLSIEHIGSTAVENLDSKPIIDIAIGLSNMSDVPQVRSILEEQDFIFRGDTRDDGEYLFVKEIEQDVRTHHIHIVDKTAIQWKNYISFRDKLRSDKKVKKDYQELKRTLNKQFRNERVAYTEGKSDFIKRVLKDINE